MYDYNGFNQLTVLKQGTTATAYAYNASGIRTAKRTATTKTYFLLDGGNMVAEYANGEQVAHYVWGINLIRRQFGTSKRYYLFNAHGDVVCVTNGNGGLVKYYDYDAFGNDKNPSSSDKNPFRYCSFNQLTISKQGTTATAYAYNASGIRTAKRTATKKTYFLLDGGNVVAEYANGEQVAHYVWGINPIRRRFGTSSRYYLFNARSIR